MFGPAGRHRSRRGWRRRRLDQGDVDQLLDHLTRLRNVNMKAAQKDEPEG
jgi:hypothetical protein